MKKLFIYLIISFAGILLLTACELFGYELQRDAEYHPSPINPKLDVNAYEFIESRKRVDMFLLSEAIEIAGCKSLFEEGNRTYIILNDEGFIGYMNEKRYSSLSVMPADSIRRMLNAYIIPGRYHSLDLTTNPLKVTAIDGETAIYLSLKPSDNNDAPDNYHVMINNIPGAKKITEVVTSNLQPTNGIMHVVRDYVQY